MDQVKNSIPHIYTWKRNKQTNPLQFTPSISSAAVNSRRQSKSVVLTGREHSEYKLNVLNKE